MTKLIDVVQKAMELNINPAINRGRERYLMEFDYSIFADNKELAINTTIGAQEITASSSMEAFRALRATRPVTGIMPMATSKKNR